MLEFLGLALTLGGPIFLLIVWRPAAAGTETVASGAEAEARVARGAAGGCLLLALGSVADLVAVVAGATGVPPAQALSAPLLLPFLAGTRYGRFWIARALAVAALAALLLRRRRPGGATPWLPVPVAAAGALITLPPTGHAAVAGASGWAMALDAVHLLATTVWIGGLFTFATLPRPLWDSLPAEARDRLAAELARRFSPLGAAAAATLLLTGIWAALAHIGALARPDTPYGLALAVKHGLFAAMLAAAAGNRLLGLRRAGAPTARGGRAAAAGRTARRLRAGVRAEAALGIAALAAAALLGTLPPPNPR